MNITKLLNKVYFAPRLKEIELYTEHAGELQAGVLKRLVRMAAIRNGERNMTMPLFVLMKISKNAFPYRLTKKSNLM